MRWIYTPLATAEVEEFSRRLGVSPVLAELLLRNGLHETDAATRFLRPALAELQDPFLLVNLAAAVARLKQAIARRETLVVLGDYDVDGVKPETVLPIKYYSSSISFLPEKIFLQAAGAMNWRIVA